MKTLHSQTKATGPNVCSLKNLQRIKVNATLQQGAKLSALKRTELISLLKTQKELFKTKMNLVSLETSTSQNRFAEADKRNGQAVDCVVPNLSFAQIKHLELLSKPKKLKEEIFDESLSR